MKSTVKNTVFFQSVPRSPLSAALGWRWPRSGKATPKPGGSLHSRSSMGNGHQCQKLRSLSRGNKAKRGNKWGNKPKFFANPHREKRIPTSRPLLICAPVLVGWLVRAQLYAVGAAGHQRQPKKNPARGRDVSDCKLNLLNLLLQACHKSSAAGRITPYPFNPGRTYKHLRASSRAARTSAFTIFTSSRSCARCPPCQALRADLALPSAVLGPVLCFHGCHCRISSACRCRRSKVQGVAMLMLQ